MRHPLPERCPQDGCDGRMVWNGWYFRRAILATGRVVWFGVFRCRCKTCGRTVSFLPDFCVPYKHYCTDVIGTVLEAVLVLNLSVRAVSAATGAYNAANFSSYCVRDWVRQLVANSHNLWHFGLPRLGIAAVPTPNGTGVLLSHLLRFSDGRGADALSGLCAVQCALSRPFPPYGLFRAQLLPNCVT